MHFSCARIAWVSFLLKGTERTCLLACFDTAENEPFKVVTSPVKRTSPVNAAARSVVYLEVGLPRGGLRVAGHPAAAPAGGPALRDDQHRVLGHHEEGLVEEQGPSRPINALQNWQN